MSTPTSVPVPLTPWDHSLFYNWLGSLAYHGLGKHPTRKSALPTASEHLAKETEAVLDPRWTSLPSLAQHLKGKPEHVKLVAWKSPHNRNKLLVVDSNHDANQNTVTIQAFCLDLGSSDKDITGGSNWQPLAYKELVVPEIYFWQSPQCVVVGDRLFVMHQQWSESYEGDSMNSACHPEMVHSLPLTTTTATTTTTTTTTATTVAIDTPVNNDTISAKKGVWTTSNSHFLIEEENDSAGLVVQGHDIVFVLKRYGNATFDRAVVYNTLSDEWSMMGYRESPLTIKNEDEQQRYFPTNKDGGTLLVGSSYLVCPYFREEHSSCHAYSLACRDASVCLAAVQDLSEDFIGEDDQESGHIPWMEEFGCMSDFGGFALDSSLYVLPTIGGLTGLNAPSNRHLIRHDFSTRSCHRDNEGRVHYPLGQVLSPEPVHDEGRVHYRPLSEVPFPEPLYDLTPSVMIKVGSWWVSGCGGDSSEPQLGLFQAIRVRRPSEMPETRDSVVRATAVEPDAGRSNFVHLGLEYYDKCIENQVDLPRDSDGNYPMKFNREIPRLYLSFLLALDPSLAMERNEDGKLPLQIAVEHECVCSRVIRELVKAYPRALQIIYPNLPPNLMPHVLASLQLKDGHTPSALQAETPANIYSILQLYPDRVLNARGMPKNLAGFKRKS